MDLLRSNRISLEFSAVKYGPISVPGYLKKTLPAKESNTFLRKASQLFWKT